uniref:Uncharacterized protein n=1 Tax=Vespula pensylvanica TaxID=30213 RepID=A0A834NS64_VESPE|nr:hypothetical protein H0235_011468 [Vespula pensylvanica]
MESEKALLRMCFDELLNSRTVYLSRKKKGTDAKEISKARSKKGTPSDRRKHASVFLTASLICEQSTRRKSKLQFMRIRSTEYRDGYWPNRVEIKSVLGCLRSAAPGRRRLHVLIIQAQHAKLPALELKLIDPASPLTIIEKIADVGRTQSVERVGAWCRLVPWCRERVEESGFEVCANKFEAARTKGPSCGVDIISLRGTVTKL